jgi:hypothetical protein
MSPRVGIKDDNEIFWLITRVIAPVRFQDMSGS